MIDPTQDAVYCLARHYVAMHKQDCCSEPAAFFEPCEGCKLANSCIGNPDAPGDVWIAKTEKVLKEVGLSIKFANPEDDYRRFGLESYPECIDVDSSIQPKEGQSMTEEKLTKILEALQGISCSEWEKIKVGMNYYFERESIQQRKKLSFTDLDAVRKEYMRYCSYDHQ